MSQPDHASRVVVFLGVNVCVGCRWKLVLLFVFTPGPFRRLRLLRKFCPRFFSVFTSFQVQTLELQSSQSDGFSRPFLCLKVFFRVHPYLLQGNRSSRARVVALAAHAAAHPASLLLPFPSFSFPTRLLLLPVPSPWPFPSYSSSWNSQDYAQKPRQNYRS